MILHTFTYGARLRIVAHFAAELAHVVTMLLAFLSDEAISFLDYHAHSIFVGATVRQDQGLVALVPLVEDGIQDEAVPYIVTTEFGGEGEPARVWHKSAVLVRCNIVEDCRTIGTGNPKVQK